MSLLDTLMPAWELREIEHMAVRASPETTWSAVRATDAYRIPFVRNLFAIRRMPDPFRARVRGGVSPVVPTSTIYDVVRAGNAFRVLGELRGREIVVGAVGEVSQSRIEFANITPESFASVARSGAVRVAISLAVAPRPGGAWITIDLRVATTDPDARARQRSFWRAVGRFSRAMREAIVARLSEELGRAVPDERSGLAGDEFLPAARAQVTHHIDIEAPPAEVWPWLVQMGCRRGGWYSWDLLDNGGVPSAGRTIPSLQKLAVGDILPMKPSGSEGFAVLALEPPRTLVLGDPSLASSAASPGRGAPRATWAFSLEPIGDAATHLVVRVRAEYEPTLKAALLRPLVGGVHEVMERKQLRTLKQRAEAG